MLPAGVGHVLALPAAAQLPSLCTVGTAAAGLTGAVHEVLVIADTVRQRVAAATRIGRARRRGRRRRRRGWGRGPVGDREEWQNENKENKNKSPAVQPAAPLAGWVQAGQHAVHHCTGGMLRCIFRVAQQASNLTYGLGGLGGEGGAGGGDGGFGERDPNASRLRASCLTAASAPLWLPRPSKSGRASASALATSCRRRRSAAGGRAEPTAASASWGSASADHVLSWCCCPLAAARAGYGTESK